jgi:hypothetical protein
MSRQSQNGRSCRSLELARADRAGHDPDQRADRAQDTHRRGSGILGAERRAQDGDNEAGVR